MRKPPAAPPARRPVGEQYDAVVDLLPMRGAREHAFALVKRTFSIAGDRCVPSPAEPLALDFRDARLFPRLQAGSDFWPHKPLTDVVVEGSAFSPGGRPVMAMTVAARIGPVAKRVAVFGRRLVERRGDGSVRISETEPFTEMPLTFANAYGGLDPRVPMDDRQVVTAGAEGFAVDHPGLYPRNPFGKGYLVGSAPASAVELPNLEDPDDLLTEERVVVQRPEDWYLQPLPWCMDRVHLMTFPRYVHFLGADAWFPGPDDEAMPEVRRGFLHRGYRTAAQGRMAPELCQEASHGMTAAGLSGGEPVAVEGMHPDEPVIRFTLPAPPRLDFTIEGQTGGAPPRVHSVLVRPAARICVIVYGATVALPRVFVPGIHKRIPVAVSIDGDAPIAYETPPTLKELAKQQRAPGPEGR